MIYKALKTVSSLVAVNAMTALTAMFTIAPNPPPADDKSNLDRLIAMGIPRDVAKNALEQAHDNLPMASGILMEQLRRDVVATCIELALHVEHVLDTVVETCLETVWTLVELFLYVETYACDEHR